jgi:hypothetical protein
MKPRAQVEYRAIADLKELPGNPRTIKKDQFEKLKQSIKDNADYFEARPIILSDRTGELVILAGNQRYKAAKAIGLKEVPTILLPNLTEEREKEIIIRDNVENGDWDWDALFNEWDTDKLQEWGVNNIKQSIQDEKDITENLPTIVTSFITFDYSDEIQLAITDETATALMEQMVQYKQEKGTYDGFWDERLKNE